MNERRRFLRVIGASVAAIGAASVGCGSSASEDGSSGAGGSGAGGSGAGAGGDASASTASSSSAGGGGDPCNPPGIDVGTPGDFASDGLHKVSGTKVLVGRDGGGIYAVTSVCTHKSCDMNVKGTLTAAGITCVCHGSQFTANGSVTKGPATQPLRHYAVALSCDMTRLVVDTMTIVDASTRLEV